VLFRVLWNNCFHRGWDKPNKLFIAVLSNSWKNRGNNENEDRLVSQVFSLPCKETKLKLFPFRLSDYTCDSGRSERITHMHVCTQSTFSSKVDCYFFLTLIWHTTGLILSSLSYLICPILNFHNIKNILQNSRNNFLSA
jgi:hypothetical protein